MALVFCQVVKKYQKSLSHLLLNEKKLGSKRKLCTWPYVASHIVTLLLNYPTGLTRPVLLTELLTAISLPYKIEENLFDFGTLNEYEEGRSTSISELYETKEVDLSCYLECYIRLDSRYNFEGTTRIVSLVDKIYGNDGHDENTPVMEMYLHQKAMCYEQYIFKYPLLMTNLRVRRNEQCGKFRLLPTEYFIPVLDSDADQNFIAENFGTLEGILDEDAFPHYTRNIFVTITEIGDLETLNNPFYDSAEYIVLGLIDSSHVQMRMILWDEAVTFRRLMSVGDSLGIEDPFLINDDGDVHLEYGPATIFFSIPDKLVSEKTQHQAQQSHMKYTKKTADGKLDFQMHPYQVLSTDVTKDCINISLFGVVRSVSLKEPFHFSTIQGFKFIIEVYDDYGALEVQVYDNCMSLHEQIYVGHMVLLENITTDDDSSCTLQTWNSGRLSILSALKGYVASPCLYNIASGQEIIENGNYFIIGKISGFQPLNGEYTRKVHMQCLRQIKKSKEGKLVCPYCKSKSLLQFHFEEHEVVKNMPFFWKWRYSVCVSVELQDVVCTTTFDATDQVCEQLIKLSAKDFSERDNDERRYMLSGPIGKNYVFSVSRYGDTKRIDAFEFASENFLANLELPGRRQ